MEDDNVIDLNEDDIQIAWENLEIGRVISYLLS